jgi:hypothetical protein
MWFILFYFIYSTGSLSTQNRSPAYQNIGVGVRCRVNKNSYQCCGSDQKESEASSGSGTRVLDLDSEFEGYH